MRCVSVPNPNRAGRGSRDLKRTPTRHKQSKCITVMKTTPFAQAKPGWRVLTVLLAPGSLLCASMLSGSSDKSQSSDGWKIGAPRGEIRPALEFKQDGGPGKRGSLIIRAAQREGLERQSLK